jgi:hypothetical protein
VFEGTSQDVQQNVAVECVGDRISGASMDRPQRHAPHLEVQRVSTYADWPELMVALAAAGFDEDELRKSIGLNYLPSSGTW